MLPTAGVAPVEDETEGSTRYIVYGMYVKGTSI